MDWLERLEQERLQRRKLSCVFYPKFQQKIIGGEITFEGQELLSLTERQMRKIRGQKKYQ